MRLAPSRASSSMVWLTIAAGGLLWMIGASVIVGTLTAIAVAYGLIDPPF